jgi:tRNA threonylcarbamoyladenosine biosynthesis protein TsaE
MKTKSNTIELSSAEETSKYGQELSEGISQGGLICLYGELGSGKTTLTKGIAAGLGIDAFSVKSPTYTYIRKYKLENNDFYHIDLYRLNGVDELIINEINEIISNQNNIVVIEWAERLKGQLNKTGLEIHLEYAGENTRKIKVNE